MENFKDNGKISIDIAGPVTPEFENSTVNDEQERLVSTFKMVDKNFSGFFEALVVMRDNTDFIFERVNIVMAISLINSSFLAGIIYVLLRD